MKFKKRKITVVPKSISDAGGTEAAALTSSGKASLNLLTLKDWETYAKTLNVNVNYTNSLGGIFGALVFLKRKITNPCDVHVHFGDSLH